MSGAAFRMLHAFLAITKLASQSTNVVPNIRNTNHGFAHPVEDVAQNG